MNAEAGGESTQPAAEPATPGELLRRERERRALTVRQAAEHLHLDAVMVEAIEANRFVALGAPVYARGHLKKYATLLGLSPEFIIQRYEALSGTPVVPTPVPASVVTTPMRERRSLSPRRSLKGPLWIAFGLLALIIAWWVFKLLSAGRPDLEIAPTQRGAGVGAEVTQRLAVAAPGGSAAMGQFAIKPAAFTNAGSVPSIGAGEIRLRLEFSKPSWTEIYDSAGNRLMFDMGAPGRVRTVKGVPPLRVTLGFASAVSARIDDRPLVIPRRAGKDAARFIVGANGEARPMRGEVIE